jgi:hypothetical protein
MREELTFAVPGCPGAGKKRLLDSLGEMRNDWRFFPGPMEGSSICRDYLAEFGDYQSERTTRNLQVDTGRSSVLFL